MDHRLAPAEHYDRGMDILEQIHAEDSASLYLEAIAEFLAGLLRAQTI